MGKSSKKFTKVDAAPAVAPPTKSAKNGKGKAEEVMEKQASAKKRKRDVGTEQAVEKQKIESKAQKKINKKVESSSSDDAESEEEQKVKVAPKKGVILKGPRVEESSSDDSSSEDEAKKQLVAASTNGIVGASFKKGSSSSSEYSDSADDSESDDSSSSDDDKKVALTTKGKTPAVVPKKEAKEQPVAVSKNGTIGASFKKDSSTSSEDSDSSEEDENPKSKVATPPKVVPVASVKNVALAASKKEVETIDDSESDDSSSSDDDVSDVEMVDAVTPKAQSKEADTSSAEKAHQTPVTLQVQATGSKTLYVGNLLFSVERADVENFFKDAGEIVDIRFPSDRDGAFKGFGYVEFATAEDAQKALKLNAEYLLGRPVKLDLARERGSYTPFSGKERDSYQKGGKVQGQKIFVRGFDKSGGVEQVRSALEEHFGTCGEITRLSIPREYGGDELKGFAYIDFKDSDSFNKALELSGSELEGYALTVEEARPRGDTRENTGSGRGGGRSGGRFGGRGGRSGGRDSRDQFGSRGCCGSGGGRFGGGRGLWRW